MDTPGLTDTPIKVEFCRRPGLQDVSRPGAEVTRRSGEALAEAMGIVRQMADKVHRAVGSMVQPPSEVELSFGIKFDSEAGALIAKASVEAALNVTLRWGTGATEAAEPLV
ncbi:CU044_2847 family protein [Micromonospora sp. U21]|uniref:CU044_2847 family protein n=1 Tax=Micromonospora sp. U21 TaxID=2824899 RepID=UPI001B37E49C|nr:CU044_2847 family protein [Micromonospora sp. U21]MBQ0906799.1 hypothetical protein [Micromonospora sp. U21]